ncbi:hypothetical protein PF008_g30775 [Phytophthora fragariae]|uniref:Uncharacterized protein n=1 Tax=Phytophthora fragariae TaxID=53985 RepID=A0A6G0Q586_9STRA|nr:hypothetical protein PF008_g30775 [Phytophthora fragariae]
MSKKSVRWSTVTVYEFGVGIGGSAVPRRGGPAVGLAKTPRRVRWLKPLERVTMLEKAGYSEERIYRMLMESSSIAQSRRLCLRAVSLECAAA